MTCFNYIIIKYHIEKDQMLFIDILLNKWTKIRKRQFGFFKNNKSFSFFENILKSFKNFKCT